MRSKSKSKYKNIKIEIDGIRFDSKVEANYYLYLKTLKVSGKILMFELQPEIELQPKFEKFGKKFRAIKLKADFKVFLIDGSFYYVDIKGVATETAKIKRKMYNFMIRDVELKWICFSKIDGGWIDYDQLTKNRKERKLKRKK